MYFLHAILLAVYFVYLFVILFTYYILVLSFYPVCYVNGFLKKEHISKSLVKDYVIHF